MIALNTARSNNSGNSAPKDFVIQTDTQKKGSTKVDQQIHGFFLNDQGTQLKTKKNEDFLKKLISHKSNSTLGNV